MEKRKLGLIITIFGVLFIIIASVIISMLNNQEEKNKKYIEENVKSSLKNCVKSLECKEKNISLSELINKGYLKIEIENYNTSESYIDSETFEIYLKE